MASLKNLSYRNRLRLLLPALVLGGLLIYYMAVKKTILLIRECREVRANLTQAGDAPRRSASLNLEIKELKQFFRSDADNQQMLRHELLEFVTIYCQQNHLILREFPRPMEFKKDNLIIETNLIVVEGGFIKLLDMAYQIEQKKKIGKLSSICFQSRPDLRTQGLALSATLYIQSIKKI